MKSEVTMESLQFPNVLLDKMNTFDPAPLPTSTASYGSAEEFTSLFDNNFADQFLNSIDDPTTTDNDQRTAAEQLLLELEQEMKDESSDWLDSAIPIVLAPSPAPPAEPHAAQSIVIDETSPKNTEELLFEFDAVCNAVGITPPASPPMEYLEGAPIFYVIQGEEVDAEMLLNDDNLDAAADDSSCDDFIDELVRSHSSIIPSSDSSDASYSPRSDMSSPRSDSSYDVAGFDSEWKPVLHDKASTEVKRKKRPYGRPVEEKKVRKKEQNKNAATRYRQKKKQQLEVILGEEEQLKAINMELQTKFDDTKREINYLKKLMREILIAKGISI